MSMDQKGYVDYVGSKDFGNRKLWSFRIRGVEKWFRTGSTDPKLQKNDHITFQFSETRGGSEVDVSTISRVDLGAGGDSVPNDSVPSTGYNRAASGYRKPSSDAAEKDAYWRNKEARDLKNEGHRLGNEKRIQFQAARNAAIATVDILTRAGAIIVPEKKGAGAEAILGKIADLTQEYYESTTNLGVESEVVYTDNEIPHTEHKEVF